MRKASVVLTIRTRPLTIRGRRHLQSHMLIMLLFFLQESLVQVRGNHPFNSRSLFTSQGVELAIASMIHVVSPHIAPYLWVFVEPLELLSLRVPVVFESDRVVGKPEWWLRYPLELAVRLTPISWLLTVKSSRSLSFWLYCSTISHRLFSRSRTSNLFRYNSDCLLFFS